MVVIDGNLLARGIRAARRAAATTATWFELVLVVKVVRIVESGDVGRLMVGVRWCLLNVVEFCELVNVVWRSWVKGSSMSSCSFNLEFEFDAVNDVFDVLVSDIVMVFVVGCECVVFMFGLLGVIVFFVLDGDVSNVEYAYVFVFAVKSAASFIGAGDVLVGGVVGVFV